MAKVPAELQVLMLISPVTRMAEHVKALTDGEKTVEQDLNDFKNALDEDKDNAELFVARVRSVLDVAAALNVFDEDMGKDYLSKLYNTVLLDHNINIRISEITDDVLNGMHSHDHHDGDEINTGAVSNQGGYL